MIYERAPWKFSWEGLGDVDEGRGRLGPDMPVFVYRLLQYTLRDVLAGEYGNERAADLFRKAGHLAGKSLAEETLDLAVGFDFFIASLTDKLKELKIGIMSVEKADIKTMSFTVTISEDLDCSGLPVTGNTVCDYDEGFIAGVLEAYTGKPFDVREVDCWANGHRICRFQAQGLE